MCLDAAFRQAVARASALHRPFPGTQQERLLLARRQACERALKRRQRAPIGCLHRRIGAATIRQVRKRIFIRVFVLRKPHAPAPAHARAPPSPGCGSGARCETTGPFGLGAAGVVLDHRQHGVLHDVERLFAVAGGQGAPSQRRVARRQPETGPEPAGVQRLSPVGMDHCHRWPRTASPHVGAVPGACARLFSGHATDRSSSRYSGQADILLYNVPDGARLTGATASRARN